MALILSISNIGWAEERELYTFDVPVIDKIIVEAEKCKGITANLTQCKDLLGLCQEESKLNENQITACDAAKKEMTDIVTKQQSTIEDVNRLIEEEKSKASKGKFWLRLEWGTYGTIFGAILTGILMLL